ncbi:MAG TPA: NifB/NifX family molybdenum-iron cluster-binding protein [Polyangiaceae bacterium]|nr:NifB/NifX family molybdenum-iron cluster-binding protein [Polyangiaceae bacterium]
MQKSIKQRFWIVAAATNNGVELDVPLGQAKIFALYEVAESGARRLLEHRLLSRQEHLAFHNPAKLSPILDGIDIIVVRQAGHGAIRSLAQRGTRVFEVSGSIDGALNALLRRGRLLDVCSKYSPNHAAGRQEAHVAMAGTAELTLLRSRLFGHVTRGLA